MRTILIERLDRELFIREYILRDLKRDVSLASTAEPNLDSDPNPIRQTMGAMAQYDRTMVVLKLRAARKLGQEGFSDCLAGPGALSGVAPDGFRVNP